jgi:hypothetical protein
VNVSNSRLVCDDRRHCVHRIVDRPHRHGLEANAEHFDLLLGQLNRRACGSGTRAVVVWFLGLRRVRQSNGMMPGERPSMPLVLNRKEHQEAEHDGAAQNRDT